MPDPRAATAPDAAPPAPASGDGAGLRADLRKLWDFMREVSGDDAYERYLQRHARTHPDVAPLSSREFFAQEQARRWGSINRCC
jgi:uncharacterized short protein YbdD (DUF466 family)